MRVACMYVYKMYACVRVCIALRKKNEVRNGARASAGWREGRDPSPVFDTSAYLAANPDIAAAGLDPLDHYLRFGVYEGRSLGDVQVL